MVNRRVLEDWLVEQDMPMISGQPDPAGGQAPAGMMGDMPMGPSEQPSGMQPNQDPNITNMPQDMAGDQGQNQEQEPVTPDMPDDMEPKEDDFEVWKNNYFKESIKGDTNQLIDLLNEQRDKDNLQPYQRKFV